MLLTASLQVDAHLGLTKKRTDHLESRVPASTSPKRQGKKDVSLDVNSEWGSVVALAPTFNTAKYKMNIQEFDFKGE
jgi:hypothetical protein